MHLDYVRLLAPRIYLQEPYMFQDKDANVSLLIERTQVRPNSFHKFSSTSNEFFSMVDANHVLSYDCLMSTFAILKTCSSNEHVRLKAHG